MSMSLLQVKLVIGGNLRRWNMVVMIVRGFPLGSSRIE